MDIDLIGWIVFDLIFDLLEVEKIFGLLMACVGVVEWAVFAEFDFYEEDFGMTHVNKFIR